MRLVFLILTVSLFIAPASRLEAQPSRKDGKLVLIIEAAASKVPLAEGYEMVFRVNSRVFFKELEEYEGLIWSDLSADMKKVALDLFQRKDGKETPTKNGEAKGEPAVGKVSVRIYIFDSWKHAKTFLDSKRHKYASNFYNAKFAYQESIGFLIDDMPMLESIVKAARNRYFINMLSEDKLRELLRSGVDPKKKSFDLSKGPADPDY